VHVAEILVKSEIGLNQLTVLYDVVGEEEAINDIKVKVSMIPAVGLSHNGPLLCQATKKALNHHSLTIKCLIVLNLLWCDWVFEGSDPVEVGGVILRTYITLIKHSSEEAVMVV
jgi:hypothetical protein